MSRTIVERVLGEKRARLAHREAIRALRARHADPEPGPGRPDNVTAGSAEISFVEAFLQRFASDVVPLLSRLVSRELEGALKPLRRDVALILREALRQRVGQTARTPNRRHSSDSVEGLASLLDPENNDEGFPAQEGLGFSVEDLKEQIEAIMSDAEIGEFDLRPSIKPASENETGQVERVRPRRPEPALDAEDSVAGTEFSLQKGVLDSAPTQQISNDMIDRAKRESKGDLGRDLREPESDEEDRHGPAATGPPARVVGEEDGATALNPPFAAEEEALTGEIGTDSGDGSPWHERPPTTEDEEDEALFPSAPSASTEAGGKASPDEPPPGLTQPGAQGGESLDQPGEHAAGGDDTFLEEDDTTVAVRERERRRRDADGNLASAVDSPVHARAVDDEADDLDEEVGGPNAPDTGPGPLEEAADLDDDEISAIFPLPAGDGVKHEVALRSEGTAGGSGQEEFPVTGAEVEPGLPALSATDDAAPGSGSARAEADLAAEEPPRETLDESPDPHAATGTASVANAPAPETETSRVEPGPEVADLSGSEVDEEALPAFHDSGLVFQGEGAMRGEELIAGEEDDLPDDSPPSPTGEEPPEPEDRTRAERSGNDSAGFEGLPEETVDLIARAVEENQKHMILKMENVEAIFARRLDELISRLEASFAPPVKD